METPNRICPYGGENKSVAIGSAIRGFALREMKKCTCSLKKKETHNKKREGMRRKGT